MMNKGADQDTKIGLFLRIENSYSFLIFLPIFRDTLRMYNRTQCKDPDKGGSRNALGLE